MVPLSTASRIRLLDSGIFALLLGAILVFRYLVLVRFGFVYTDSDQTIMWYALNEYSRGIFHEPRFFGQSYNSMLEALLAVPLYRSGLPPQQALPLLSSLLTLAPFVAIAGMVFLKRSRFLGLVILSIPLMLPVEYSMITSLSRGFVTGIFVASGCVICALVPSSGRSHFLAGLFGFAGFALNANAILIAVPCLLYLWLRNRSSRRFYLLVGCGSAIGLCFHLSLNLFYYLNPRWDLHGMNLQYAWPALLDSLTHLDDFFNDVSPLFRKNGFLVLILLALLAFLLVCQRSYSRAGAIAAALLLIVLSPGFVKVHNGTSSVFFPLSRFFLALPVVLALAVSFLREQASGWWRAVFLVPLLLFGINIHALDPAVSRTIAPGKRHVVGVIRVDDLLRECAAIQTLCTTHRIGLVLVIHHWNYDFYDFGCPACETGFPNTLRPSYERRTWRLLEDEKTVYPRILLIDLTRDLSQEYPFIKQIPGYRGFYRTEENRLPTMELLHFLGMPVRPYQPAGSCFSSPAGCSRRTRSQNASCASTPPWRAT